MSLSTINESFKNKQLKRTQKGLLNLLIFIYEKGRMEFCKKVRDFTPIKKLVGFSIGKANIGDLKEESEHRREKNEI